jgi:hypothetical protein
LTGGDGKRADTTGHLTFGGGTHLAAGTFTETIGGEVGPC